MPYLVRPLGTLDPWSLKQKSVRKRLFWHLGVKRMLTGAAAIHYTSAEEKRLVETGLGLSRGVVVPNGLDLSLSTIRPGVSPGIRPGGGRSRSASRNRRSAVALMSWPFRAFTRKRDLSC